MGNSLRCCLSCVLPFGSLDMIRILHFDGAIEELRSPITAAEVLRNYPNHILTAPSSDHQRILILSPESQLKRGSIYFLIPNLKKLSNSTRPPRKERKPPSRQRNRSRSGSGVWKPYLESVSEDL